MSAKPTRAMVTVFAALVVVGVAVWRTGLPVGAPSPRTAEQKTTNDRTIIFDHTSLTTAEELARMPTTAEEQPLAEEALRIADSEMDLAFRSAVRLMESRPKVQSAEVKEADGRLQASLAALTASQARVASLTAALAKATPVMADGLSDRLDLAKAQAVLDQDEVDDARQDVRRAGGDPQGRIQEIMEAHEVASKQSDSLHVVITPTVATHGTVGHARRLWTLQSKSRLVRRAQAHAESLTAVFQARHDSLEARDARAMRDSGNAGLSHDSTTALLASAKGRVLDAKARSTLDQRVDNQKQLASTYAGWLDALAAQRRGVFHDLLRDLAVALGVVLAALLAVAWISTRIAVNPVERRGTHTLYSVARVATQVLAVLVVLLVIFGPPDSFSTVLGLGTAGLTVALKDFIIGFLGWFVLMGENGVRVGDLVEVDGVTGEVTQIGLTQTEVLETGHWSEAGHPTGRRATFSNGFAISGHYFNFSTDGRWLMDEVRVVVPAGRDPYPIAEALQTLVRDATTDWAHEAEAQWQKARHNREGAAPSAEASVTYKPIMGGTEVALRFISRPAERDALRAKLFQKAVDLIGAAAMPAVPAAHPVVSAAN